MGFEYIDHFSINEKSSSHAPATLGELATNIASCHLCDLSKSRRQSMQGYGDSSAKLMVIDYSVSQAQDRDNAYYSGRSGETLKNMLERVVELSIEEVFLTHCIKCKPLNSNKPSPSEWNSCKEYLYMQMEFLKPKVVVTLGEEAYAHLTGDRENFENVRGHIIEYKEYRLIPIYHPSYLLRNPHLKPITMVDLKTIKSCL